MVILHNISKNWLVVRCLFEAIAFLPTILRFLNIYHVFMHHVIILSQNGLHHWIPRGRFTPFSHEIRYSTDLRFLSVVWIFPYFRHFSLFKLKFRHWSSKISDLWRHRDFSSTISESASQSLSDPVAKFKIRPVLSASRTPYSGVPETYRISFV